MNEAMEDVTWIGDSREQVRRFPKAVRRVVGEALRFAQRGARHPKAKLMRGIGSGVWEIVAPYATDAYRAVYTVNIGGKIYVLHAFQKKSTRGTRTPKREIDLIKQRLKIAQQQETKQ